MSLVPYRFLFRVASPCRYVKGVPAEEADRLLDLPETCRIENFAVMDERKNFADVRNKEYGAFIQDRLILNPKLQVELGVRYDRERVTGQNNFGPRASFSFLPFGITKCMLRQLEIFY